MNRRRRVAAAAMGGLTLLATACGTRLPDSAFQAAQGSAAAVDQGAGDNGGVVGPESSAGPGGAAGGGANTGSAAGAPAGGSDGSRTGGQSGSGSGSTKTATKNTASDVGVTPTMIRVGAIDSISNPFDPEAFVGPFYGAKAFFQDLNAHGGVNGRMVQLYSCDDRANGARNQSCVRNLIDTTKVFAFAGNAIFDYSGAPYVQQKDVPDIGGQPIDNAYSQYSHIYSIYGGLGYPRNGQVGYNGTLYGGTENYRYFKVKFPNVARKAGVVYYNQAASASFGKHIADGLRKEGYQVDEEQVDFALPDFNSAVIHMKSQGVQYVYDVMDVGGNESLCKAMDQNNLDVKAKVTTTQSWTANIKTGFADSPHCRNSLWAMGNTLNYEDTQYPTVKEFRAAMKRYGYDGPDKMSEWALEGWASAQWLADAMSSCGADLTRKCVEAYMDRSTPYTGHGLLTPRDFTVVEPPPTYNSDACINVVRWQDSANGGQGGWVTQVADMNKNCFAVPYIPYQP
ncbi:MAG TPA: ABC transporter substrate-binding protein [Nocardioidaceae bacterium]|nr:ABC transporter substrate-binding protein [Nocardioidaceae bacterium]